MDSSRQGSPVLITDECHRALLEEDLNMGDHCSFLVGPRYGHEGSSRKEQRAQWPQERWLPVGRSHRLGEKGGRARPQHPERELLDCAWISANKTSLLQS